MTLQVGRSGEISTPAAAHLGVLEASRFRLSKSSVVRQDDADQPMKHKVGVRETRGMGSLKTTSSHAYAN